MWTVDLYVVDGATGIASIGVPAFDVGFEAYRSLGVLPRAAGQVLGTLLVAMVVLGLLQGYGPRSVSTARRSPIISLCIGLPATLVVAGLASTGHMIVGSSLGTFFGIPLVILGLTVLPALTALGFVAIGRTIAARLGRDRLGVGVLVGSVLAGLAGLSIPGAIVLGMLAASLGVGAGVRVLFAASGTTQPDERSVPPANKI